jgi:hypothetical protein
MKTENEISHSEAQARAQAESIAEMVGNLTREGAAQAFVDNLSDEEVLTMGAEASLIEPEDETPDLDSLRDNLVSEIENENFEPKDFEWDEDDARQAIQDDPLSVEVRSGWYNPGGLDNQPEEFCILLCTGGPAVRIIGELDMDAEPVRAWIEYQDWGTPWTELFNPPVEQETLLTYC